MDNIVRGAGVMLPLASLPGRHGVGDMGGAARAFVELLAGAGAAWWQILPLNPLGYGNSPYQPYSSFAGDPLYISLDALYEELGLTPPPPSGAETTAIEYDAVRRRKDAALRHAFSHFVPDAAYERFAALPWARTYAVFMALKRKNGMRPWQEWPPGERDWPQNEKADPAPLLTEIRYELFVQHIFFRQWLSLRAWANGRGVQIIGDIPIYVGLDSHDVWAHRENFLLDAAGAPTFVAGVPPDYFSETGQRWGNPLYDWAHMERDGFAFWIERLRQSQALYDIVRIDHFRGFDTYWAIPAACETAAKGTWREAPGYRLLDAVFAALPGLCVIAEDLGMLREEVYALRDHYGLRGMKILEFTLRPGDIPTPAKGKTRQVVYTGTHDNQTVLGWYRAHALGDRLRLRRGLWRAGMRGGRIAERFVRLALLDASDMAVIPVQDILGLPDTARINTPGTVGPPNWEWKLASLSALSGAMPGFASLIRQSGRSR